MVKPVFVFSDAEMVDAEGDENALVVKKGKGQQDDSAVSHEQGYLSSCVQHVGGV